MREKAISVATDYQFYNDLVALARSGPIAKVESYFWKWLPRAFSDSCLVQIRSLYAPPPAAPEQAQLWHSRTQGLGLLLRQISENCHVITWEWFQESYGKVVDDAEGEWTRLCGCRGALHLPRDVVEADLGELKDKVKPIASHVNGYIAHFDRHPTAARDVEKIAVEDALGCIERILNRYLNILVGWTGPLQASIDQDWAAIFRQPWVQRNRGGTRRD